MPEKKDKKGEPIPPAHQLPAKLELISPITINPPSAWYVTELIYLIVKNPPLQIGKIPN